MAEKMISKLSIGGVEYTIKDKNALKPSDITLSKGYSFFDLDPVTEGGFKVFAAKDHAINRFTLADANPVKVILPNATDANGRDFILKVNVTSETMPTFEIVKPSDAASVGIEAADDGWANLEAGINYFTITETDRA